MLFWCVVFLTAQLFSLHLMLRGLTFLCAKSLALLNSVFYAFAALYFTVVDVHK